MRRTEPTTIDLRIDRLVLDGPPLTRAQERLLRAALAEELARLIAAGGLDEALLAGGALRSLPAGALPPDGGGEPGALGRGIARALYAGLGGATLPGPDEREG